jgi:FemAB-related protein (PEP-CTERM system-associated)
MVKIFYLSKSNLYNKWDTYLNSKSTSTLYHLSGWKNIIEKTYGHKTHYLMAIKDYQAPSYIDTLSGTENFDNLKSKIRYHQSNPNIEVHPQQVTGILPLVQLKSFIFGNHLVSIPFFDLGGIVADDEETEKALLSEALRLAKNFWVDTIELRHTIPLTWLADSSKLIALSSKQESDESMAVNKSYEESDKSCVFQTHTHKVRMLMDLPSSSQELMKSFKSKLRSQIKKPIKEGLYSKIGNIELLDDFYDVFALNMRDLGSPVHSRDLIKNVLEEFRDRAKTIIIYRENQPVAGSIIIGFKDILENPWASSLRKYSKLSPNMLLYWTMLEYACDNGYKKFDFGRSTPVEGTYKFKEQWGAKPEPLYWYNVYIKGNLYDIAISEKTKFKKAIQFWSKLPVSITKSIGPKIRKNISL